MPRSLETLVLTTLVMLAAGQDRTASSTPEVRDSARVKTALVAPDLFAFHSSFWVNLHHFLYVTARARKGLDATRPAVTNALGDTAGFGALSQSDQGAWHAAVAYYDSAMAQRDILFDSGMVAITTRLTSLDSAATLEGSDLDPPLAAALDRAAPVYRRLWWPRHDAANRRWETGMRQMLAMYGDSLAARESRAVREPWSSAPVRVDIAPYTNWTGAYTVSNPARITVASVVAANEGHQGLEILFHEVLHTMDDTLLSALKAGFEAQGKTPPRDLTHAFIFYTAGELTRRAIPGHVPYAEKNGIWSRIPEYTRAFAALKQSWRPYLDGEIAFDEAIRRYVTAM